MQSRWDASAPRQRFPRLIRATGTSPMRSPARQRCGNQSARAVPGL